MDSAEIARLREWLGSLEMMAGRWWATKVRALLDALEQARKEIERCRDRLANIGEMTVAPLITQRNAAQQALEQARKRIGELDVLVSSYDKAEDQLISERDNLTAQRDAAQQSAKDARALLAIMLNDECAPICRYGARIEAMLEQKP